MLFTMSDTFERATKNKELAKEMKEFSNNFIAKFRAAQLKENAM